MHPRPLALLLSVGLTLVAVLAGVPAVRDRPAPPEPRPVVAEVPAGVPAAVAAIDVLRDWDLRRSRAWAGGDVRALRELYVPGSRTGRHDRAALTAYAGRSLRVTGLRMQLLAVDVARSGQDRLVLAVTDRMTGSVARGGGVAVALPRDQASSWRVSLRRLAGEWRVVEIRRAPT